MVECSSQEPQTWDRSLLSLWGFFQVNSSYQQLRNQYSSDYPAMRLALQGQCWDWFAWCQYVRIRMAIRWELDLQLLSQCDSMHNCRSRSIPVLHQLVAGTPSKPPATTTTLKVIVLFRCVWVLRRQSAVAVLNALLCTHCLSWGRNWTERVPTITHYVLSTTGSLCRGEVGGWLRSGGPAESDCLLARSGWRALA